MNNPSESESESHSGCCSACQLEDRRCGADCPFAPYFPSGGDLAPFVDVLNVFGGADNVLSLVLRAGPDPREQAKAMAVLVWTAHAIIHDPFGSIPKLRQQQAQKHLQAPPPDAHSHAHARDGT